MGVTRGAVLDAPRAAVRIGEIPLGEPREGEARVRMEACGICHSNLDVAGLEKLPLAPVALGHEGIGRVEALGPSTTGPAPGCRVGITFLAATCGACALCRTGRERFCARQVNTGYTTNGVLAGYAVLPVAHLVPAPEALEAAVAAPLCRAGWTAYGALREAGLRAGESVAIFGLGGLGHPAVQYAFHRKLKVIAVGARHSEGIRRRRCGPAADALARSRRGGAPLPQAHRRVGAGRVGEGALPLPVVDAVLRGISVRGSYLGTRADLEEVFRLAETGVARPRVEVHELSDTPQLLERLARGELLGRAVIGF